MKINTMVFIFFLVLSPWLWAGTTVHNLNLNNQDLLINCKSNVKKTRQQLQSYQEFIVQAWNNKLQGQGFSACRIAEDIPSIMIILRADGVRVAQRWSGRLDSLQELSDFILDSKRALGIKQQKSINAMELIMSHSYKKLDYADEDDRQRINANIHRGMKGLEISFGHNVKLYSPSYAITSNQSHKDIIKRYAEYHDLDRDDLWYRTNFRLFEAVHLLVYLDKKPRIYHLYRGNELLDVDDVSQDKAKQFINLAAQYLINSVDDDGRMNYDYFPSEMQQSKTKNNMIRQWLASISLVKYGNRTKDEKLWKLSAKNIEYNLAGFYHNEGLLGVIEYNGKTKLGAMSMAVSAIIQHPDRQQWQDQEMALRRTMEDLWNNNGAFDSFLRPKKIRSAANFYPGETLLSWALLYQENKDKELLNKFMKSFSYYRQWHLDPINRNPAFIPWHTQAYYKIWMQTKNNELKHFIFTMNDWLIDEMHSSNNIYPDTIGRFYKASGKFGVPHASSTAIYLDGLVDAYRLAVAVKDTMRAKRYKLAIIKGLRSLLQLQFVDEVDMYYVPVQKRQYVTGAVHENVYNNKIRIDQVAHALIAVNKIVDTFQESDFLWTNN